VAGPRGIEMSIRKWDFRTGCAITTCTCGDGGGYRFNGTFHTVRHDEFLIQTLEFEGAPDMVNIEYMWFEDLGGGRSSVCGRFVCPNIDARDALLSSGMEGGMTEGYERLDSLLSSP
jgi:uncharacterized protein YndB with AHSA1/START domain